MIKYLYLYKNLSVINIYDSFFIQSCQSDKEMRYVKNLKLKIAVLHCMLFSLLKQMLEMKVS